LNKGKLIVFEGPDFSGKSTQIQLIKPVLKINQILYTREPGSYLPESAYYCEEIRNHILNNELDPFREARLFADSRYEHTKEMVKYINEGFNIICDRYIVSSLAYQGYAQNLGKDRIYELNRATIDLLEENEIPIYTFKFDLSRDTWNERKAKRLQTEKADSIETKDIHNEVFEFFSNSEIYNNFTDNFNIYTYSINANGNKHDIHENVYKYINELIK
jgi:dTMP kinase